MISQDEMVDILKAGKVAPFSGRIDYIRSLYYYATNLIPNDGLIVEIGTNHGESTIAMACAIHGQARSRIVAIDPVFRTGMVHVPDCNKREGHVYESPAANVLGALQDHGLAQYVTIIPDYSWNVLPQWQLGLIDLLFVDGEHTYEAIQKDCQWMELVRVGGFAVFDDWLADVENSVRDYLRGRSDWRFLHESTSAPSGDFVLTILEKTS